MKKKEAIKELCVTVFLDNEYGLLIARTIRILNDSKTSFFVDYVEFGNVELTIYFPLEVTIHRNDELLSFIWTNRYDKESQVLTIKNEAILSTSMEECFKMFG